MIINERLPKILPLFPLQGTLLMPKTQLPFYVSEHRYIAMVADIMKSHCFLGVIQTVDGDSESTRFFKSGIAGQLTSVNDIGDDKLLITVEGISRFDVVENIQSDAEYPEAVVSYDRYEVDLADEVDFSLDRNRLFKALKTYFKGMDVPLDWKELETIPNDKLVTAIAMLCPFEPREKQAVLELPNLREQSELITRLIEMANISHHHSTCH